MTYRLRHLCFLLTELGLPIFEQIICLPGRWTKRMLYQKRSCSFCSAISIFFEIVAMKLFDKNKGCCKTHHPRVKIILEIFSKKHSHYNVASENLQLPQGIVSYVLIYQKWNFRKGDPKYVPDAGQESLRSWGGIPIAAIIRHYVHEIERRSKVIQAHSSSLLEAPTLLKCATYVVHLVR